MLSIEPLCRKFPGQSFFPREFSENSDVSDAAPGTIPPELGQLKKLTHLSLGENKIRGTVPAEIGDLSSLNYLYLNGNRLGGKIPKAHILKSIFYRDLHSKKTMALTSENVSQEIGKLTKLQHLGLWTNAFEV